MLGRRSGTIVPTIGNTCNTINTQFQTIQRLWLKIILSAMILLMIGVFTITTALLQDRFATQQREQLK
jgi:hypothetical protein